MMEKELSCAVVRDLLPLYAEGLVSEETKGEVEAHLAGCAACAAYLEEQRQQLPAAPQTDTKPLKQVKKRIWRGHKIAGCITGSVVLLIAAIIVLNLWTIEYSYQDIADKIEVVYGEEDIKIMVRDMPSVMMFGNWPGAYTYIREDCEAETRTSIRYFMLTSTLWDVLFSQRRDVLIERLNADGSERGELIATGDDGKEHHWTIYLYQLRYATPNSPQWGVIWSSDQIPAQ